MYYVSTKGQIKPKADCHAVDSPKKRINNLFSLLFTANKTNVFVCFLGESKACPNCFKFYVTFNRGVGRCQKMPIFAYCISAYSLRGNYCFLKVENVEIL